jgi:hypothetical protein
MFSENKRILLAMALIPLGGVLAGGAILRFWGQTPATLLAESAILALAVTGMGAVLKANCYPRRALVGSAVFLALGLVLPAVLVPQRPGLGGDLLHLMTYCWMFLFFVSISPRQGPAWCKSVVTLIMTSVVLASAFTLRFLLF